MPDTTQFGNEDGGNGNNFDGALQPNTILLARYKIDVVLGGGGQGAVYRARDLNFPDAKRMVAVKEMLVSGGDPSLRASSLKTFQREANILATLAHAAIPRIYDFFDQNDRAYLVMEYINGSDLEAILHKTKKLPIEKIMEWAIDLCDVLHYLHSQSDPIIFRDMKPANIMIDSQGKVRLIDFGIAKVFVSGVKQTMIGTEGYSAPEQYRGNANPLSDIYSLGASLHHVITRKDPRLEPPFSFAERPLHEYNTDVMPQLQSIIEKSLQFEPENRWQTCAEMKTAFEQLRYRPIGLTANMPKTAATGNKDNFFEGAEADLNVGIQPKWKFKTEDEIRGSAIVFRDIVYIGSYDTNIWAVKAEDGSLVWKRATEGGIVGTPSVDTDLKQVLFGSEDTTFNAVDCKDGRIAWSYMTGNKIRSSARIAHGHVFFGSDDGKLYALMASNGRHMWEYDAGSPIRSTPVVTSERIIFGTDAGEIVALELSGQRRWVFKSKKSILSSPHVDIENVAYIGSMDNHLYAFDAEGGYSLWRFRTNGAIIATPVVDRNSVFFGSTDGKLYCVNTQTGKEKWTFQPESGKPIVSSPIVHENVVYFGGTDHRLYAVDARLGKKLWDWEAGGAITGTPCIANNLIIFGALDATLYALPLVAPTT